MLETMLKKFSDKGATGFTKAVIVLWLVPIDISN